MQSISPCTPTPNPTSCSSHGTCVNISSLSTTNNITTSSSYQLLCQCSDGWSGSTDMFDLRILSTSAAVTYSLDCPINNLAIEIIWCFTLATFSIRYLLSLVALISQIRSHGIPSPSKKHVIIKTNTTTTTIKGKLRQIWRHTPYRVLFRDCFLSGPCLLALGILKIQQTSNGQPVYVIGTDISVTLLYVFGTLVFYYNTTSFTYVTIKALTRNGGDTFDKTVEKTYFVATSSVATYFLFACIPVLISLGTNKSLGPIQSFEYVVLLLRNIGCILHGIWVIIGLQLVKRETHKVRMVIGINPTTERAIIAQNIISTMIQKFTQLQRVAVFAISCHVVFMLPWLWPFQTYMIGILSGLIGFDGLGGVLLAIKRASNTTKSNSNSGSNHQKLDHKQQQQGGNNNNNKSDSVAVKGDSNHKNNNIVIQGQVVPEGDDN
jgi:hypothetical protein